MSSLKPLTLQNQIFKDILGYASEILKKPFMKNTQKKPFSLSIIKIHIPDELKSSIDIDIDNIDTPRNQCITVYLLLIEAANSILININHTVKDRFFAYMLCRLAMFVYFTSLSDEDELGFLRGGVGSDDEGSSEKISRPSRSNPSEKCREIAVTSRKIAEKVVSQEEKELKKLELQEQIIERKAQMYFKEQQLDHERDLMNIKHQAEKKFALEQAKAIQAKLEFSTLQTQNEVSSIDYSLTGVLCDSVAGITMATIIGGGAAFCCHTVPRLPIIKQLAQAYTVVDKGTDLVGSSLSWIISRLGGGDVIAPLQEISVCTKAVEAVGGVPIACGVATCLCLSLKACQSASAERKKKRERTFENDDMRAMRAENEYARSNSNLLQYGMGAMQIAAGAYTGDPRFISSGIREFTNKQPRFLPPQGMPAYGQSMPSYFPEHPRESKTDGDGDGLRRRRARAEPLALNNKAHYGDEYNKDPRAFVLPGKARSNQSPPPPPKKKSSKIKKKTPTPDASSASSDESDLLGGGRGRGRGRRTRRKRKTNRNRNRKTKLKRKTRRRY